MCKAVVDIVLGRLPKVLKDAPCGADAIDPNSFFDALGDKRWRRSCGVCSPEAREACLDIQRPYETTNVSASPGVCGGVTAAQRAAVNKLGGFVTIARDGEICACFPALSAVLKMRWGVNHYNLTVNQRQHEIDDMKRIVKPGYEQLDGNLMPIRYYRIKGA